MISVELGGGRRVVGSPDRQNGVPHGNHLRKWLLFAVLRHDWHAGKLTRVEVRLRDYFAIRGSEFMRAVVQISGGVWWRERIVRGELVLVRGVAVD